MENWLLEELCGREGDVAGKIVQKGWLKRCGGKLCQFTARESFDQDGAEGVDITGRRVLAQKTFRGQVVYGTGKGCCFGNFPQRRAAVTAGLVSGRKMTCYEHVKFELEQGGGKWLPEQAVRDGQYVTGQTWESHPEFYREVMGCLRG